MRISKENLLIFAVVKLASTPPALLANICRASTFIKREEMLIEKGTELAIRFKGWIQFQRQQKSVAFFTVNVLCPVLHQEEQGEK
jgi:hypothetical protein